MFGRSDRVGATSLLGVRRIQRGITTLLTKNVFSKIFDHPTINITSNDATIPNIRFFEGSVAEKWLFEKASKLGIFRPKNFERPPRPLKSTKTKTIGRS